MIIEYLFDTLKAWKQSAADAVGSQLALLEELLTYAKAIKLNSLKK
jgi:hypothetical protein